MAQRSAKIACSIDAELLARVERLRGVTGESRSAFISRALLRLTREEARAAAVRGYVDAYRRVPETSAEIATARRSAMRALEALPLEALPWEDE